MKTYRIKEIFRSIQGEGYHAGGRAVFVRFAGCNVWSGREEDRKRDSSKGVCARFCDTDFVGGDGLTAEEIANDVRRLWGAYEEPFVVLTGGEPTLQMDHELIDTLSARLVNPFIAVETNGSREIHEHIDWITLSPKPPLPVVLDRADEVKVVYPDINPHDYASLAERRYVQPCDGPFAKYYAQRAADFVIANPGWRLSLQLHKFAGVP